MRLSYLDSTKFLMIFLMVYCHCLSGYKPEEMLMWGGHKAVLYDWVYLFHMPTFILISGYCFNRHKDWKYNINSSVENFMIYVLFQAIWVCLRREFSLEQILTPRSTLWFLMAIPFWKVLSTVTRDIELKYVLIISVVFSSISSLIANPEIIQNILTCWVYFVVGMILREYKLFDMLRDRNFFIPIAILVMVTTFLSYYYWGLNTHRYIIGRGSLMNYENGMWVGFLVKIGFQMLSLLACLSVVVLTVDIPLFSKNGKYTLSVYVFHLFILHILMATGRYLGITISYSIIVFYAVIAIWVSILVGKTKIGKFFLKPVTINKR